MSDLISRQAVIDTIETDCSWDIFNEWGSRTPTGECIINAIKSVPSVEPERKPGKWVENKWGEETCSECGYTHKAEGSNYCPNCGAKMEVEE